MITDPIDPRAITGDDIRALGLSDALVRACHEYWRQDGLTEVQALRMMVVLLQSAHADTLKRLIECECRAAPPRVVIMAPSK